MKPKAYPWTMAFMDRICSDLLAEPGAVLKIAIYAGRELQNAGIDGNVVALSKADIMKELKISDRTVETAVKRLIELKLFQRLGGKGCYEFVLSYAQVGQTAAHKEAKRTKKESTQANESLRMQRESSSWASQSNEMEAVEEEAA